MTAYLKAGMIGFTSKSERANGAQKKIPMKTHGSLFSYESAGTLYVSFKTILLRKGGCEPDTLLSDLFELISNTAKPYSINCFDLSCVAG